MKAVCDWLSPPLMARVQSVCVCMCTRALIAGQVKARLTTTAAKAAEAQADEGDERMKVKEGRSKRARGRRSCTGIKKCGCDYFIL